MELLFYSGIVSITDWKYTTSVGIKSQVFWAGPCNYNAVNFVFIFAFVSNFIYLPPHFFHVIFGIKKVLSTMFFLAFPDQMVQVVPVGLISAVGQLIPSFNKFFQQFVFFSYGGQNSFCDPWFFLPFGFCFCHWLQWCILVNDFNKIFVK